MDKKIRTNNRKNTIGREQPFRTRESIQQISGFFREQRNNKRHRNKHSVETGTLPGKTKNQTVPLYLQEDVGRELEKLLKSRHLKEIIDVDEDCFVPVVIAVRSDKSVKNSVRLAEIN